MIVANKELSAFITHSPSSTQSVVSGRHLLVHKGEICCLTELNITEMPISEMVFQECLEINTLHTQ